MEKLIYDRVWLEKYMDEIAQQKSDLNIMRECLLKGKDSLMPIQIPFYLEAMEKIDRMDQNFRNITNTVDRFLSEMRALSLDLERFSSEKREMLGNSHE